MENQHTHLLLSVAEIELIYKSPVKPSQRPQVKSSLEVFEILRSNWDVNKIEFVEQFKVLLLNRNNRVLGIYEVSTGGTAGTVVDLKLLFASAIKSNASSIIISHNHPSGNTNPSKADECLTRKIKEAGNILGLPLTDHIIICPEGYYSFADEGML